MSDNTEPLVTISDESIYVQPDYILLQKGNYPARKGTNHGIICPREELPIVLAAVMFSKYVAIDFETRGADYSTDLDIVGIGLAWDNGSVYFNWASLSRSNIARLGDVLRIHPGLIAHNIYFDGGVVYKQFGFHPRWFSCTYALLAMTANEGYPGVGWGLKAAQTELLGWASSNEHDLDQWLVLNGYYRGPRRIDNTPEYLQNQFETGGLKANKGEMWRAPTEILGKYCILDAESTYLLFTKVLLPVCEKFPALLEFHRTEFMRLITILIDQKFYGIPMNREGLAIRRLEIANDIEKQSTMFRKHSQVVEIIDYMEGEKHKILLEKEPPKRKKDGQISKNWINWKERVHAMYEGKIPEYSFNFQSGPQLRELFYEHLEYPVRILTEKGEPSTSLKALKHLGEAATHLMERMWSTKELSYVDKYIELTVDRETIHPSFRSPGTVTGRLSSKDPNMQQIPKTKAMMELFVAKPGTVWVDLDFSALEPVVTTEFSGDRNMESIYGNGRLANDIYLFVGASIPGEIGKKIRATGYDPLNPTPEALARAKKECKHERGICKTVVLACSYGAGVKKVMQTLEDQDIFLEYEQVELIHSTYWKVFGGVRAFSKELYRQWRNNEGYILNGLGRPMAVPENLTQDLLNRFVQSTGHDILVKYIYILTEMLAGSNVPWKPIIIDFHDSVCIEVPEEWGENTVHLFNLALVELNTQLQGRIQLRGVPVIGRNLSDCKEPES